MRHFSFLLLAICLMPAGLWACLNDSYRTTIPFNGNKIDLQALLNKKGEVLPYWQHGFKDNLELEGRRDSLLGIGLSKLSYQSLSDYAAIILRIGDKGEAVKILEQLYTQHPADYTIVANLGTAYELTGNDSKALELIRKAVAINPNSHYNSEWIHVRILEEKLGAKQYHRIIDLGITDYAKWIVDKKYVFTRNPDSLKVQIAYQLHERIGFIAPPDDIVGQLILDFADIVAKTETRDEATPFYEQAQHYGTTLDKTVASRKQAILDEKEEVSGTFRWASLVWALPLLAFFAILFAWMRTIRRNKRAGQENG